MAPTAQPDDEERASQAEGQSLRADALGRRHRILEAASALTGDRHVTMSEVAAAAGVGRSTLYRHFPSREALGHALDARETLVSEPAAAAGPPVSWQVATMAFLAPGRLGREHPLALEVTRVLDEVPPHLLDKRAVRVLEAALSAVTALGLGARIRCRVRHSHTTIG
ncbi:MAG: helix-turn-helix domain-containing protein [Solirubrobacteraceae bacterium]